MDVNKILGIIHNHDGDAVELAKSLGGALEMRRAQTAKKRAGGQQMPPSKFMPNVPRQVHADGGWVEHYEFGGTVEAPQKTVKAYKLFRKKGDNIYPLFVDANTPVPMNQWIAAKAGDPGKDPKKVKSKLGDLAYRPGWHAGDLPIATHIGGKSDAKLKKPDYRPDEQVWAEVEMPNDVDWQSVANERAQKDKSGNIKPVTAHITDQVPHGGHYRYKTNPNMTGNWLIGGSMKVNRILDDEEVRAINSANGVADLPRLKNMRDGGSVYHMAEGGEIAAPPAAEIHEEEGYKDPNSILINDWKWRPLEDVQKDLNLKEIPSHVHEFGKFMDRTAEKASKVGLSPRDLIKAYTITRASIQRRATPAENLRKAGLVLPDDVEGMVRPEGAFGHWLHTPAGQAYLDAAQNGQVNEKAIQDAVWRMAPFGRHETDIPDALRWAAENLPQHAKQVSELVAAGREKASTPEEWRRFTANVRGIGPSKSGFVASLMGRGDQPTLDARQIILHTGKPSKEASPMIAKKGGAGGVEAVERLAARQRAMNLKTPEGMEPYYQHLAHHAVWDKASNEETTHQDVMDAMQHAATGGAIHDHPVEMIMKALHPESFHEPHRRAEEQGYSIKGYHVTRGTRAGAISSAKRFDPSRTQMPGEEAAFFWDNPEAANKWGHYVAGTSTFDPSEMNEKQMDRAERHQTAIMPVRINPGKHLVVDWPEETGEKAYTNRHMSKILNDAREQGYDTVRIKNMAEHGPMTVEEYERAMDTGEFPQSPDQIAVLNPAMIRSEFANFDPEQKGRDDIGAAHGGTIEGYAEGGSPKYKTWHDVPIINPQDLVGKRVFPIFADLTKAGEDFKGIDSIQIAHPEKMMGGPGYPLLPESQMHNLGWAVEGKGRGSAKIRKDADYVVVSAMEPYSHQSNATFANSLTKNMLAYAANGRISEENLKNLNEMVRKESDQKELQGLRNFPGFEHPDAEDFIRNAGFEQRSRIADIIGSREAQNMGAPNMEKLIRSTMDQEFAGVPSRHGLFLLEIPKGSEDEQLVNLKEAGLPEHPSYKYGIKGRIVGRFAHPVSPEILFQEWFDKKRAEQKEGKTNIRRAFDLAMPVVTVSQEVADMLPRDPKDIQSGKAAKLALNAFNDQWHDTETPVNQGGLGPAQLSHALKNSDMSSTLSQYTPEEIKKMAKEGKFTGYKLKDGEIYFGLKRGTNYADEYGFEHPDLTDNETALVSVVNNEMGAKGIGGAPVVLKAIQHGATALDAFAVPTDKHPNGFLPDFYSNFGFEELGRIPFDPKYVTKDQFDDMKHEWSKTGWDEQKHGLPSIAIMKWRGNEDDRSDAIRRHVTKGSEGDRAGTHPVNVGSAAGTPERGPDAGVEPAQGGRELGDVGRDLGPVRNDSGSRPADRFTRTLTAAAQLNPTEAQHFGITPEDIAPAKKTFGFARGGSIDLSHALEIARRAGNNGDTILAHINPQEAALLKRMGGSGTINPKTGLPQFGVDDGPEAGSTGSAAGNSYGTSGSADDSPSESGPGPRMGGGNGNNGGSGNDGSPIFGGGNGNDSSGIGPIGTGSMVGFGNPALASTFGKQDPGAATDEQLAKDYAGYSSAFLAGMPSSQLAKDYVLSATGNSPMVDPFVSTSDPEMNRVIAPSATPTIQVPNDMTNKQIAAMFRTTPTTAMTATTPVQAAAESVPSLSDIMGTTPQGNYLFSGMDLTTKTVPNSATIDVAKAYELYNPVLASQKQVYQGLIGKMTGVDPITGQPVLGKNGQPVKATGTWTPSGPIDQETGTPASGVATWQTPTTDLEKYNAAIKQYQPSFTNFQKQGEITNAETNWGAPANMASYAMTSPQPQGFGDVYGVSPSAPEETQYATPSRPVTPTPSTAYAQDFEQPSRPITPTPSTAYAQNQTTPVASGNQNIPLPPERPQEMTMASMQQPRGNDGSPMIRKKPRFWFNPATGKMEPVPENTVMARGGRTGNDWESMIRRALEVAFRYGS